MSIPWEKPFVLSEIHEGASNWSLACDARLLLLMEEFSKGIFTSVQDAGSKMKLLAETSEIIHAKLANVSNNFSALSSSQFIENRVDEIATDKRNDGQAQAVVETRSKEDNVIMEKCTEALRIGLTTLDNQFQRVDITPLTSGAANNGVTSSNIAEIPKSSIFVPINPYASRRLPALIGSLPFFADDFCGLCDPVGNAPRASIVESDVIVPNSAVAPPAGSPPPPPPPPPPLPPTSKQTKVENIVAVENEHSKEPSDGKRDEVPTSLPTSALGSLHSELLGKMGRPSSQQAQLALDDNEDDGDLFSQKPSQPRYPVIPIKTPSMLPSEDTSQSSSSNLTKTSTAVSDAKYPASLTPALRNEPGNSLFDAADDDDLDDLFSSSASDVKSAKPPAIGNVSSSTKLPISSRIETDISTDNGDEDKSNDDHNIKTSPLEKRAEEHVVATEDGFSAKQSRSDSTVSQKKLPTGAVSIFGSNAKADPLADALRSRFSVVGDRSLSISSSTSAARADSLSTPNDPVSKSVSSSVKPSLLPSKEPTAVNPISKPNVPVKVSPRPMSTLFDDDNGDEDVDLFKPNSTSRAQPNSTSILTSAVQKPISKSLLFGDEDDEDLFSTQPKSLKQTTDVASSATNRTAVESSKSDANALPVAPATKPIAASSLFDDDEDEDLFGVPAKIVNKVSPSNEAISNPIKRSEITSEKDGVLKARSDDDDEDLFGVPAKIVNKVSPSNEAISNPVKRSEITSEKDGVLKARSDDDDEDLFGVPAKVFSKVSPSNEEISKPVKRPEITSVKDSVLKARSDDVPSISDVSPILPVASGRNDRAKNVGINPLSLLPGARPPKPAKENAQITNYDTPIEVSRSTLQQKKSTAEAGMVVDFEQGHSDRNLAGGNARVSRPGQRRPSRWVSGSVDSESVVPGKNAAVGEVRSHERSDDDDVSLFVKQESVSSDHPLLTKTTKNETGNEGKKVGINKTAPSLFDDTEEADIFTNRDPRKTVSTPKGNASLPPDSDSLFNANDNDDGSLFGSKNYDTPATTTSNVKATNAPPSLPKSKPAVKVTVDVDDIFAD